MLPTEAEIVVVGGGPTGLVLSSVLRQAGHDVLTLDRQEEGANASRAAAIHAKTLEVLRELEVTDQLIAEGVVVPTFTFRDRDKVLTRLEFSSLPTPYPFVLTPDPPVGDRGWSGVGTQKCLVTCDDGSSSGFQH
ncbi:FAD-dependent oxidoreductase, partial [Actinacidiphila soli]|uniref:FAD-dependent oxidoreductase n=1 Tax=Actinacidiphila soli TaxID=2487275 RepID=UPI0013E29EBD